MQLFKFVSLNKTILYVLYMLCIESRIHLQSFALQFIKLYLLSYVLYSMNLPIIETSFVLSHYNTIPFPGFIIFKTVTSTQTTQWVTNELRSTSIWREISAFSEVKRWIYNAEHNTIPHNTYQNIKQNKKTNKSKNTET